MAGTGELNTTTSTPAPSFLFDPSTIDAVKKAKNRVRDWLLHNLPDALKKYLEKDPAGLSIFVNEVNCGNARCAPVHVSVTFLSKEPGKFHRTIDIPKALADVRQKDVADFIDFVRDDLLGCITDDPPTKKRRRDRSTLGRHSAAWKAARAFGTMQPELQNLMLGFLADAPDHDEPMEACTLPEGFMSGLTSLVLARQRAELALDPSWRPDKTPAFGALTDLLSLLGKNMDVFEELPLLEGLLDEDRLKDVFVEDARRVHYREIIKQGHNLAAELVLRNWHNGGNGAEVDSEVPHPFWVLRELADHLARLHDGDDARELLKVMAEDRRDYLLGLCCDEGESRVCRCGDFFTNSRDVRNHIMKAGPCHEHYVLRWLDESMLYWCSGGCGNDLCGRRQSDYPLRPFFKDTNRRMHEEGAWPRPKAAPRPKHEPRKSRYVGVDWHRQDGIWTARVKLSGTTTTIGRYHDEELAARKRDAYIRRNRLTRHHLNFDESGAFVPKPETSSRFTGVVQHGKKWKASLKFVRDGALEYVHCGTWDDEERAALAYNEAARAYNNAVIATGLGRVKKLNPIDPVTRRPIPKDQY